MRAHLRPVLAANLLRAAEKFDSLARLACNSKSAKHAEERLESQAAVDAGAAIWEAVLLGLLRVPAIAGLVGALMGTGHRRPESLDDAPACVDLFYDTMREFIYPRGGGLLTYYCFRQVAWSGRGSERTQARQQWRQHESVEMATGCRMLAGIIERAADSHYQMQGEHDAIRKELAETLQQYSHFIREQGKTGGDLEAKVFTLIYKLRCYVADASQPDLNEYCDLLLNATSPYEERPPLALEAAEGIRAWLHSGLSAKPIPKRPAYDRDHLWLEWHEKEKLGPAKIVVRWDTLSDEERQELCPTAAERVGDGGREAGRNLVKRALAKAKKDRQG